MTSPFSSRWRRNHPCVVDVTTLALLTSPSLCCWQCHRPCIVDDVTVLASLTTSPSLCGPYHSTNINVTLLTSTTTSPSLHQRHCPHVNVTILTLTTTPPSLRQQKCHHSCINIFVLMTMSPSLLQWWRHSPRIGEVITIIGDYVTLFASTTSALSIMLPSLHWQRCHCPCINGDNIIVLASMMSPSLHRWCHHPCSNNNVTVLALTMTSLFLALSQWWRHYVCNNNDITIFVSMTKLTRINDDFMILFFFLCERRPW